MSAGKGSKARNNFSAAFRDNFEAINWGPRKPKPRKRSGYEMFESPRPSTAIFDHMTEITNRILNRKR